MNSGPTSERIYDDTRDLVTSRETRPGIRLDPAVIARQLNASTTPVREALNRLVGERLVETRTSTGYHVPLIDEPSLKDLIGWSADILTLALRRVTALPAADGMGLADASAYPDRIGAMFHELVRASGHPEYIAALLQANARLHPVRHGEPEIFDDLEAEFTAIIDAMRAENLTEVRKLLQAYHRRRQRLAAELVRLRYRGE
jgi:DNA-binding GntR family transcriptional regulator